jgi:hypothetical protein
MNDLRRQSVGLVVCMSIVLVGGACSSLKVQHVSDPAANLAALKTFAILPNNQEVLSGRILMGQPLSELIEKSITRSLEARGKTAAPAAQAQMIVRWVANIEYSEGGSNAGTSQMDLRHAFAAQNYVYTTAGSGDMPYMVTNGAVAVDIEDAQTKKSVWRGLISGVVKEKLSDPQRQERLDKALAKLFESVPAR